MPSKSPKWRHRTTKKIVAILAYARAILISIFKRIYQFLYKRRYRIVAILIVILVSAFLFYSSLMRQLNAYATIMFILAGVIWNLGSPQKFEKFRRLFRFVSFTGFGCIASFFFAMTKVEIVAYIVGNASFIIFTICYLYAVLKENENKK